MIARELKGFNLYQLPYFTLSVMSTFVCSFCEGHQEQALCLILQLCNFNLAQIKHLSRSSFISEDLCMM